MTEHVEDSAVGRCVVTNVDPTQVSDLHVSVVDVEVGQVGSRVELFESALLPIRPSLLGGVGDELTTLHRGPEHLQVLGDHPVRELRHQIPRIT